MGLFTGPVVVTVPELVHLCAAAWKSLRAAATAKGLTDLADMMFTDWAMGRHTWKMTEPRPTYVGEINISDDLLREEGAPPADVGADDAADDSMMVEESASGVDLLTELAGGQDLPVDPQLMGKGARKRTGGALESGVSNV